MKRRRNYGNGGAGFSADSPLPESHKHFGLVIASCEKTDLRRTPGDLLIFVHHPPFDIGLPPLDSIRMMNGEALAPRLTAHGWVRHIFFDHAHRVISGSWRGIPVSTLPSTVHQAELQFEERVLSPGNHEPPAYGLVLADADSLMLHTHFFMDDSPRFIMDHREVEEVATLADLAGASS